MTKSIGQIEGVGPQYANALRKMGISTTAQLLLSGGTAKGRRELAQRIGISEGVILKWVNLCDLFRIKGVARQYAELLKASGVDTVKELRNRNASNLLEKLRETNLEKKLVRQVPGASLVERWVAEAKQLNPAVHY